MRWSDAKDLDVTSHQPLDPYVHWADASHWRGYASVNQFKRDSLDGSWITFLAELSDVAFQDAIGSIKGLHDRPLDAVHAGVGAAAKTFKIYIPFVYRDDVPGSSPPRPSRFFTGRIQKRHLGQLRHIKQIARWELAQPVGRPDDREAPRAAVGRSRVDDAELEVIKSCIQSRSQRPADSDREQLMGVIDSGCAFLQSALRSGPAATRIVHFWDQGVARKRQRGYWSPASNFGYGSVLWGEDIDRLIGLHAPAGGGQHRDELRTYQALSHMVRHGQAHLPVRRAMHGTHVMDVLAGCRDPWQKEAARDDAAKAPLAFVQLPRRTLADGSGGSLGAHVLDGVRQLMTLVKPEGKLVISISQGSHAGPHDGSSLIERALDELLSLKKDNFAIVVGAGNARRSDCHAHAEVLPQQTVELALRIPLRDTTDSFAEVWYPRETHDNKKHQLRMRLQTPSGELSDWVAADQVADLKIASGQEVSAVASLFHASHVAGGLDAMALVALSPSSNESPDPDKPRFNAPSGIWRLLIENTGTMPCPVHAWSERDEPIRPPWRDYPRWLSLPPSKAGAPLRVGPSEVGTLSNLATAEHVLVAGALVVASGKQAGYSSLGPPRGGPRLKAGQPTPNVWAAADESNALPGVRAAAVRGGDTVRMSGTSVAAPTLARQLFNRLIQSQRAIGRGDWQAVIDQLTQQAATQRFFASQEPIQEQ